MRIYLIEDDASIVGVLEDIIDRCALGAICGITEDGRADLNQIIALAPDLILIDLLMPEQDGIQMVRELKKRGCEAKFIMISQVSAKEMVGKAYQAGIDFYINKPINLIEVQQVIGTISRQLDNERALKTIQNVFQSQQTGQTAMATKDDPRELWRRRLQYNLSQLGMMGEKGSSDVIDLCLYLMEENITASQIGMGNLCSKLSDNPKTTEQRIRRAVERGLAHIASLGLEDYNNEFFSQYAAQLFPFQEVRAEMSAQQGKGRSSKVNLKKFLDGMIVLVQE